RVKRQSAPQARVLVGLAPGETDGMTRVSGRLLTQLWERPNCNLPSSIHLVVRSSHAGRRTVSETRRGIRQSERRRIGTGGGTCPRIPPVLCPGLVATSDAFHCRSQQYSSGSRVIACQQAPATGSSVSGRASIKRRPQHLQISSAMPLLLARPSGVVLLP